MIVTLRIQARPASVATRMSLDLSDPWTLATLAATLVAAGMVVRSAGLLRHPALLRYPWLAPMFTVPESLLANARAGAPLWARGQGQLLVPVAHWAQLRALGWALAAGRLRGLPAGHGPGGDLAARRVRRAARRPPAGRPAVGGPADARHPAADLLREPGVDGVFVLPMGNALRTEQAEHRLADFIVVMAGLRAAYSLVRFAAFGGDPANVYQNMEKLALQITFFEIGDSLVCTLGATLALLHAIGLKILFAQRYGPHGVPIATAIAYALTHFPTCLRRAAFTRCERDRASLIDAPSCTSRPRTDTNSCVIRTISGCWAPGTAERSRSLARAPPGPS
jgi:hypothetical protein